MLGRKTYTQAEVDDCRSAIDEQMAAYRRLAETVATAANTNGAAAALEAFDDPFFRSLVLALDRRFVHRLRSVTGKDGNPLNEVELLADSLMNNGGVLRGNTVIRYSSGESVLGLELGDRIRLSAADFERLSSAFLADLERKYVA